MSRNHFEIIGFVTQLTVDAEIMTQSDGWAAISLHSGDW